MSRLALLCIDHSCLLNTTVQKKKDKVNGPSLNVVGLLASLTRVDKGCTRWTKAIGLSSYVAKAVRSDIQLLLHEVIFSSRATKRWYHIVFNYLLK